MSNKVHKPRIKDGVQTPGKATSVIRILLIAMDAVFIFMMVLGIVGKIKDLSLVAGGLAIFTTAIIFLLKHLYNTSYQEDDESLIIRNGKKEVKVYYDDIINWKPTYNEISVLDKTKEDEGYIRINIAFFKPIVLIRRLTDMTFEGKFHTSDQKYFEDPYRKREIVAYLVNNHYGYLIKDYIDQVEKETI